MKHILVFLILAIVPAICRGQAHGQEAAKLPPGITISDPAYPLPAEDKLKIRDQQNTWDELEIENQKMLVRIEQNKALQKAAQDEVLRIAALFAQTKNLDLKVYGLDGKELKLAKKSAK